MIGGFVATAAASTAVVVIPRCRPTRHPRLGRADSGDLAFTAGALGLVDEVLALAQSYGETQAQTVAAATAGGIAVDWALAQVGTPYVWGGEMVDAPHTGADVRVEPTPTTPGSPWGTDVLEGITVPAH